MRFGFSLTVLVLLIGTGLIFYLSWLPDPELGRYGFLPGWLTRWTDASVNENLRTAVPFVGLGFFIGCGLSITNHDWRWWLGALLGLVSIVLIAETGQLILPRRSFDWGDVAWGALGSISGLSLAAITTKGIQLGLYLIRRL